MKRSRLVVASFAALVVAASALLAGVTAAPAAPAGGGAVTAHAAVTNPLAVAWQTGSNPVLGAYSTSQGIGEQFSSPAIGDLLGNGQTDVVAGSVDGRIYIYRAAGCAATPNGKYAAGLFQDLLATAPSGPQLVSACTLLSEAPGIPGRLLLATLEAHSRPWVTQVVQNLYQLVLGRPGDSGGVDYWVGRILGGMYQRDVAIAFYGSNEQYARWGGTSSDAQPYVAQLYSTLLGRQPDESGLEYWAGQVLSRGPAWVAGGFYQSLESRRKRVTDQYAALLCRQPDQSGLNYWAVALLTQDDLSLTAQLVSSNEYYATKVYAVCPLP